MRKISEKQVENFCVKYVRSKNGTAFKWSSPSNRGVPDRIILLPNKKIGFLELKAPGKKPSNIQGHFIEILKQLGFSAGYADSTLKVKEFVDKL